MTPPGGLLCCLALGATSPGIPCVLPSCALYDTMLHVLLSPHASPVPLLLPRMPSLDLPELPSSCHAICVPAFLLLAPFLFRHIYQMFGGLGSLLGSFPALFCLAFSGPCLPPRSSFSLSSFPPFFSGFLPVCSWACSLRPRESRIKRGSPAFYFSSAPVAAPGPLGKEGRCTRGPPHNNLFRSRAPSSRLDRDGAPPLHF